MARQDSEADDAVLLASRDLRRAAVRLWRMPLDAARSSARVACRNRAVLSSVPSAAAVRTFLAEVLSSDRTALFRTLRPSF